MYCGKYSAAWKTTGPTAIGISEHGNIRFSCHWYVVRTATLTTQFAKSQVHNWNNFKSIPNVHLHTVFLIGRQSESRQDLQLKH